MEKQTVVVVGASGLVGSECLKALNEADFCEKIKILVRAPVSGLEAYSKVHQHVVDFDHPSSYREFAACDTAFSTLGTTMKKAGSREAFFKVDYTYCLDAAKAALDGGARHFLMVSAMGASPRSSFFYNKVKGEIEMAVNSLGFQCVSIFRPSLISGSRKETRPSEELGKVMARFFDFAIPSRYKAIEASDIAKAMVQRAAGAAPESRVFLSDEIRSLALASPDNPKRV